MLTHLSPYIPYKQNDYANAQKSDGKSKHYQYFRNKNGGEWGLNNQYTTAIILFEKMRTHTTISTKEALLAEKIDKANSFSSFGRQKTQLLEKVD